MKKVMKLLSSLALASVSTSAIAGPFIPLSSGPHQFSGSVIVIKNGITPLVCNLDLNVSVDSSGDATVTYVDLNSGLFCNVVDFVNLPKSVVSAGNPDFTIVDAEVDIDAIAPLGLPVDRCRGDLSASLVSDGTSSYLIFDLDSSTIADDDPDNSGGSEEPCRVEGVLEQTNGATTGYLGIL